jgi:HSP20 family protein
MSLIHYEPVNLLDQFNNEINRYFSRSRPAAPARKHDWAPAVDIHEEDSRFVLTADVPGVSRENIDITLEDGVLTVKGERSAEQNAANEGYRRRERLHGTFLRQFTLPDSVDAEHISATVKDGVLVIEIPKLDKPQPRKISVN